jgi:hypothetical protein
MASHGIAGAHRPQQVVTDVVLLSHQLRQVHPGDQRPAKELPVLRRWLQ